MAGTALVASTLIAIITSVQKKIRELWRNKIYYSQILDDTKHTPEGHKARFQVEK